MKSIWEPSDSFWEIDRLGVNFWPSVPTGITVHYTADGSLKSAKNSMLSRGVGYHFIIDKNGSLCQTANLTKCVNHAGKAMWNGQSPNRTHIAIAVVSWGLLNEDGLSWSGEPVLNSVKRRGRNWEPATDAQELRLMVLLRSLIAEFGISPMNICGHDECALPVGRKVDPGGTLTKTMAEIRKGLGS